MIAVPSLAPTLATYQQSHSWRLLGALGVLAVSLFPAKSKLCDFRRVGLTVFSRGSGHFEDVERWPIGEDTSQDGQGDVIDGDVAQRAALEGATVGVPMEDCGDGVAAQRLL